MTFIICYKYVMRPIKEHIIRIIKKLLMNFLRPLAILDFNYRIVRSIKIEKYDAFHAHDLNALIGTYPAARKQGAKLIYDSHELFFKKHRSP